MQTYFVLNLMVLVIVVLPCSSSSSCVCVCVLERVVFFVPRCCLTERIGGKQSGVLARLAATHGCWVGNMS